jgi:integrase
MEIRKRERNGRVTYLARHYAWVDGEKKKVSRQFDRKRDAEDWLADQRHSKNAGTYVDPNRGKITLGGWADLWIESKLDLAPKTKERYRGAIKVHIKPRWEKVPLSEVSHADLQRWIAGIDAAPATVRKVHRVMSMILAYAVKDDRLAKNPAEKISLPRVRQAERRFLNHTQVHGLAEACGDHRLVVLFLAYTGLRWGEMAALRVRRIDFLRRRVLVAESVTPTGSGLVWGDTKGHERREVSLPRFLVDDLARHVEGKSADDLVFTGRNGQVLRAQAFQRTALTKAAVKVDVPGFHPHELRHTAASLAIASGADVKVVQQMMGHKSATMTLDLYGHLFPDRLDVVADAMDAARTSALSDRHQKGTNREPGEVLSFPN